MRVKEFGNRLASGRPVAAVSAGPSLFLSLFFDSGLSLIFPTDSSLAASCYML